jgi:hypothetical protein
VLIVDTDITHETHRRSRHDFLSALNGHVIVIHVSIIATHYSQIANDVTVPLHSADCGAEAPNGSVPSQPVSRPASVLARVQDPGPIGEGEIDALLAQRGAEFGGEFVQHRLDRAIWQVAEIGMHRLACEQGDRFTVRPDAVLSRPGVGHLGARERARKRGLTRFDAAPHPGPRGAHRFGDVKDAPLRVPTLPQADADPKIAPRPVRAVHDDGPALIRTGASTPELLEQLYAGEVGPALVSAKQLGLPVAAAHLQVSSLAPRLVTHKPDKNDVKKRTTSSRALHFFE